MFKKDSYQHKVISAKTFTFIINEKKHTAEISSLGDERDHIIIPRSVSYEGQTYLVTIIGRYAFSAYKIKKN